MRLSCFKIINLLSGIVLLSTLSGAQAQMDVSIEHLNAKQRAFIHEIYPTEIPPNNQGFDLLAGFAADVDQDPQQEGAKWIAQVRAHYANTQQQDSISPPSSDLAKALRKDMIALCPDSAASPCERKLLRLPPEQALALLQKYALFLNRYNTYLEMPNHVYTLPNNVDTPLPNYQDIAHAHRLSLLQLALDFNQTNNDTDRNNLLSKYLKKQIKLLSNKDPLISKMVYINIISRSINSIYLLNQKTNNPFSIPSISEFNLCDVWKYEMLNIDFALKKKEINMEKISRYIFFMKIGNINNKYNNLENKYPNKYVLGSFNNSVQIDKYAPNNDQLKKIFKKFMLIPRETLYNKNLTDELFIDDYMHLCTLSELSLSDYKLQKTIKIHKDNQSIKMIDNYINKIGKFIAKTNKDVDYISRHNIAGNYFFLKAKIDATPYIERTFMLNAKIDLINFLLKEKPEKITQAWLDQQQAAQHPIIENATAQLDVEKQTICFDSLSIGAKPKKLQHAYNCLPI